MIITGIILNLVIYNLCFIFYKTGRIKINFAFFIILAFLLFSYWSGDYLHVKEIVESASLKELTPLDSSLEPIYIYLANLFNGNYFFFRLVLWGGALCLIIRSLGLLGIKDGQSLCLFSVASLLMLSYARAYIAMAILFFGVINHYHKKNLLSSFALLVCCALAPVFHRSVLLLSIIVLINLLFGANRKILFVFTVIFFLSLFSLRDTIIEWSSNFAFTNAEDYLERSQQKLLIYVNSVGGLSRGIAEIIDLFFSKSILLFIFIHFLRKINSYKVMLSSEVYALIQIYLYTALVSIFVLFVNIGSLALFYRVANMVYIPLGLILASFYKDNIDQKFARISLFLLYISSNYSLLYSFYLAL